MWYYGNIMGFHITEDMRDKREELLNEESMVTILNDWVVSDSDMRAGGQKKPDPWDGSNLALPMIGDHVAAHGMFGQVCDYGIGVSKSKRYERCVWIVFGDKLTKVFGADIENLSQEEIARRLKQNKRFAERLEQSGKKVITQRKQRRAKMVRGSHLIDDMLLEAGRYDVKRTSAFYKITGSAKKRAVYLAVKGGRVDLSGFCIDHPAIDSISEELAKQKHLGRVRGQIAFDRVDDASAMDAFRMSLRELEA